MVSRININYDLKEIISFTLLSLKYLIWNILVNGEKDLRNILFNTWTLLICSELNNSPKNKNFFLHFFLCLWKTCFISLSMKVCIQFWHLFLQKRCNIIKNLYLLNRFSDRFSILRKVVRVCLWLHRKNSYTLKKIYRSFFFSHKN